MFRRDRQQYDEFSMNSMMNFSADQAKRKKDFDTWYVFLPVKRLLKNVELENADV